MLQICETSDGNDDEDKEGCGDEVGVEPEYFQLADAAKDWKSSNNQSLGELVHGMFRWVHTLYTLLKDTIYYSNACVTCMYMYIWIWYTCTCTCACIRCTFTQVNYLYHSLQYTLFTIRYYVFEFNHSRYAISIRQTKPLLRAERGWGSAKLAVEGLEMVNDSDTGSG